MNDFSNIKYDLLYNKDYYTSWLYENHYSDKKLSFKVYNDAVICPLNKIKTVCALDSNLNYIENSVPYRDKNNVLKSLENFQKSEIKYSDSNAILLGRFVGVWGHFITEDLKYLWFLKSEFFKDFSEFTPYYYNFKPNSSHLEFFEILGIDTSSIKNISVPTRFNKVLVAEECFFGEYDKICEGNVRFIFTREYLDLIENIRTYANKHKTELDNDSFYFSYSKYKSGKSVGEPHIEKYFKKHNYKIIYTEKFSFKQQLNILVNCKNFASTIGSCSHNMIFLNDNSNVILIPRANYLTPYQVSIDKMHKLKIFYIDSSFSFLAANRNPGEGPFLYFVSRNLKKFFNDDSETSVNFSDYKKYLRYAMGINLGRRFGFNSGGGSSETHNYYSGEIASDYYGALLKSGYKLYRKISNFARRIVEKYFMNIFVK